MRDKRFIAVHRGGLLTKENHKILIHWARKCSEHVLPLIGKDLDIRLVHALQIAKEWENDKVHTGAAMKASVGAHTAARESNDLVVKAIARSIGHAVATAHMADHSMGAALYALVAIKNSGKSIEKEKVWQNKHLPKLSPELLELLLKTMLKKEKSFKLNLIDKDSIKTKNRPKDSI